MKLKEARQKAGLTQEELADKSGLSITMIQSIEGGRRNGSVGTAVKLASALNISMDSLFFTRDFTNSTK